MARARVDASIADAEAHAPLARALVVAHGLAGPAPHAHALRLGPTGPARRAVVEGAGMLEAVASATTAAAAAAAAARTCTASAAVVAAAGVGLARAVHVHNVGRRGAAVDAANKAGTWEKYKGGGKREKGQAEGAWRRGREKGQGEGTGSRDREKGQVEGTGRRVMEKGQAGEKGGEGWQRAREQVAAAR